MDPAIYILIAAMAILLIVALIISNTAASGGAVMPHPIFPRAGPYREHGGKHNATGLLY